jgi:hypothetical protein
MSAAPNGSRRPADTAFKQQRLHAWQPILTPAWVIGTFLLIGCIFVPIGIVLKSQSDAVVEYTMQYDGVGTPAANLVSGHQSIILISSGAASMMLLC